MRSLDTSYDAGVLAGPFRSYSGDLDKPVVLPTIIIRIHIRDGYLVYEYASIHAKIWQCTFSSFPAPSA